MVSGILEKESFDYAVERPNGNKIVTNQHIQLMIDGAMKDIHFAAISNSRPTEVCRGLRPDTHNTNAYRLRSQTIKSP